MPSFSPSESPGHFVGYDTRQSGSNQYGTRVYDDHMSLSEADVRPSHDLTTSPDPGRGIQKSIDSPQNGIKFMIAILSLENALLKLEIRKKDEMLSLKSIVLQYFVKGGGKYSP